MIWAHDNDNNNANTTKLSHHQVPSLRYAQEAAESFQHDETWGERISVKHEKAMFPVFMSGLPEGVSGEELKKQVEAAAAMDPKAMKMQGEPEVSDLECEH